MPDWRRHSGGGSASDARLDDAPHDSLEPQADDVADVPLPSLVGDGRHGWSAFAVAIGLFSFRHHLPLVAALLTPTVVLRALLWSFDQWVTRDWRRFGRLDEGGLPGIRELAN